MIINFNLHIGILLIFRFNLIIEVLLISMVCKVIVTCLNQDFQDYRIFGIRGILFVSNASGRLHHKDKNAQCIVLGECACGIHIKRYFNKSRST